MIRKYRRALWYARIKRQDFRSRLRWKHHQVIRANLGR